MDSVRWGKKGTMDAKPHACTSNVRRAVLAGAMETRKTTLALLLLLLQKAAAVPSISPGPLADAALLSAATVLPATAKSCQDRCGTHLDHSVRRAMWTMR